MSLTAHEYGLLVQRTHEVETRSIAFDRDACQDLVAALGGSGGVRPWTAQARIRPLQPYKAPN
jgi:hypothetical protein